MVKKHINQRSLLYNNKTLHHLFFDLICPKLKLHYYLEKKILKKIYILKFVKNILKSLLKLKTIK